MTQDIRTERRWLRSVIAASAEPLPAFPWMRGQRRRPAAAAETVVPMEHPAPRRGAGLFGGRAALAAR